MWPYYLAFILAIVSYTVENIRITERGATHPNPLAATAPFLIIALMIGFRFEVGTDWFHYEKTLLQAKTLPFDEFIERGDIGYQYLNWLVAELNLRSWAVNLVCGVLFSMGLLRFCGDQPEPRLALAAALPYLVLVVAMGYARQGVAIGLVMFGLVNLRRGELLKFAFWVGMAATFHKSAVMLFPLAALALNKRGWLNLPLVIAFGVFAYFFLLRGSVDYLVENYIVAQYDSQGTFIRLIMSALPAVIFIRNSRKIKLDSGEQKFWWLMSITTLFFVIGFFVIAGSTAIDRMALYFIPLQLFVYSRLEQLLDLPRTTAVALVYLYSFVVMTVWLFFATHSLYWLPYKIYPLDIL